MLETQVKTWIKTHQHELLSFLSRLVQTPSEITSPQMETGELACQRIVEAAYHEAGADVDTFCPEDVTGLKEHPAYFPTWDGLPRSLKDRPDVVGRFRGSGGGKSLLISAHVDTVSRLPLPWSEAEPFSGTIKEGKLYGRGSWDTKWGLAAGLYAARCARDVLQDSGKAPLRGDVLIESVVDEEFGGGHGVLASRLRGHNADIAINCEPTGMVPCLAHRGGGQWRIIVRGDAGMNFENRKMTNAVFKLAKLIEAVRAYERQRNTRPNPPPFFEKDSLLPVYTFEVSGGERFNDGIPVECSLVVWVEEYPGTTQETHTANLTRFINENLASQPDFDGLLPEYRPVLRYLPGSSLNGVHPFLNVLEKAYISARQPYQPGGAPFACDTFIFNLYSPTPALTLGPRGGNAHAADEFVLVEDVLALTYIYSLSILDWCR